MATRPHSIPKPRACDNCGLIQKRGRLCSGCHTRWLNAGKPARVPPPVRPYRAPRPVPPRGFYYPQGGSLKDSDSGYRQSRGVAGMPPSPLVHIVFPDPQEVACSN